MPEAATPVAPARTLGIWTFIALDCTSFGLFFLVFMTERLGAPSAFDRAAGNLDARIGLANTCILVTSSWLVALATNAARAGRGGAASARFIAAVVVGSLFGILKIGEYAREFGRGITVSTNEFFSLYFALTGVHLLHYLIGLGVLGRLAVLSARRSQHDQSADVWIEGGALYWHMVDLLWVFLFAMLYLPGLR